jgi:phosphoglycerate dehydrogenase-like enzyme
MSSITKKLLLIKTHAYNKWEYDDSLIAAVRKLGYKLYMHPAENIPYTDEELDCEVFAAASAFSHISIDRFPNLKYIQGLSAGYEHFPLDEIKKRGIILCNARGVYGVPISEFILSGILNVYKKSRLFEAQRQSRIFKRDPGLLELSGKTAAIIGTGDIGRQTAKKLQAFETKTVGFNRHPAVLPYFDEIHHITGLKEYLPLCDIVVLTLPLTDDTYHLADKEFFSLLKSNCIFVNAGRGAVCNENALINVLQENLIKAAVLDVFEDEPLKKESPLWSLENAYIYPHTMSGSDNAFRRMQDLVYRNLKAYMEGRGLENRVL